MKTLFKITMFILLVPIVLGMISGMQDFNTSPQDKAIRRELSERNYTISLYEDDCRESIKNDLKSPTSAEFGNSFPVFSENKLTLTMTVDAQNSFGAMIRSRGVCIIDLERKEIINSGIM